MQGLFTGVRDRESAEIAAVMLSLLLYEPFPNTPNFSCDCLCVLDLTFHLSVKRNHKDHV